MLAGGDSDYAGREVVFAEHTPLQIRDIGRDRDVPFIAGAEASGSARQVNAAALSATRIVSVVIG
jgi:hypothetical protein